MILVFLLNIYFMYLIFKLINLISINKIFLFQSLKKSLMILFSLRKEGELNAHEKNLQQLAIVLSYQ